MSLSIMLIWLLIITSFVMILLSRYKVLKEWPKVPAVALVSNIFILSLYYSPLYGEIYYLSNILKIIPLIMLLVYFASKDPAPSWAYRAMCWVFIGQIAIYAIHILTGLNFLYYSQSFLAATMLEFIVLISGGFNVRALLINKNNTNSNSSKSCVLWAKCNIKSRG